MEFQLQHQSSNDYSGMISFRMDWFDLLAVLSPRVSKGLKSLPKNHSSKESIHSVHFSSVNQLCPPFCDPMNCSTPGLPVHHQIPQFTQTHVYQVGDASNHLILCRPLLLPPSIFPSNRAFSNESVFHIRWQKHWSFSFSISLPMKIQD